jgi:hypothetical protein
MSKGAPITGYRSGIAPPMELYGSSWVNLRFVVTQVNQCLGSAGNQAFGGHDGICHALEPFQKRLGGRIALVKEVIAGLWKESRRLQPASGKQGERRSSPCAAGRGQAGCGEVCASVADVTGIDLNFDASG